MSDENVVTLKPNERKELVWTCDCDGQLFYIISSKYARCNACMQLLTIEDLEDQN